MQLVFCKVVVGTGGLVANVLPGLPPGTVLQSYLDEWLVDDVVFAYSAVPSAVAGAGGTEPVVSIH